jgi:hypothetical protein
MAYSQCPVCTHDHPTGSYTQTIAGVRHRSRECAHVATLAGLKADDLRNARTQASLRAGKRYYEKRGLDTQCRCGAMVGRDQNACSRCGAWVMR